LPAGKGVEEEGAGKTNREVSCLRSGGMILPFFRKEEAGKTSLAADKKKFAHNSLDFKDNFSRTVEIYRSI